MEDGFPVGFCFGAVVAVVCVTAIFYLIAYDYREAAIQRGHAMYCPTTGDWAWMGECDP